jgi:prepilin-type N-terminal cleavage/methylation domain-containing protein
MIKRVRGEKRGFTLVELLVVVAIIGILMGLLLPSLAGAMRKAQATTAGNNGRQIAMAVMEVSQDMEALARPGIWLSDEQEVITELEKFISVTDWPGVGGDSGAYYEWLMENEFLEEITNSFFKVSGGKIWNSWCVTFDVDSEGASGSPFMFTDNFNLGGNDLGSLVETDPLGVDVAGGSRVLKNKMGVLVSRMGAVRIIDGKALKSKVQGATMQAFNPSGRNLDVAKP